MSSILDIPENLQVPPDYKSPPNFNHVSLFDRIYLGNAGKSNTDSELRAFSTGVNALLFLTSSQPAPGSDYAALRDTPLHIRLFTWTNRCGAFLDYLNPYLTEVRNHGAPEQKQFLHELLDTNLHEYISSKSPSHYEAQETSNETTDELDEETVLEPGEAITILEQVAQAQSLKSSEYVALQIAVRALRYIIENGESAEFMRYVEQTSSESSEPTVTTVVKGQGPVL